MDLRLLRSFIAVAEELHFGRAAARVFVAQSTLSQQIRELEDQHGVQLFERTRRSVALTDVGRLFLPHARRVLCEAERAAEALQAAQGGLVGRLRIGYETELMRGALPDVVRAFREATPAVTLELREVQTGKQTDALRGYEIDIGFLLLPVDKAGLVVQAFEIAPLVVLVPSAHRLAERSVVKMADLQGESHVMWARETAPGAYDAYIAACVAEGFEPRITQTVWHVESCLGLVAAGLGVAPADGLVAAIPRKGVTAVPIHPGSIVVRGIARRAGTPSPVLERFLTICHAIHPHTRA